MNFYEQKHIAEQKGHKIEGIHVAMCITMPRCTRCNKKGWNYLKDKCKGTE